jgi:hypothetical protein
MFSEVTLNASAPLAITPFPIAPIWPYAGDTVTVTVWPRCLLRVTDELVRMMNDSCPDMSVVRTTMSVLFSTRLDRPAT